MTVAFVGGVRILTLAFIAIFSSITLVHAQDLTPLSLDDAIAIGLAHNRTLDNAALQIDKSGNDIATARSRRLPTFQVEAQASQLLRPIDITFPKGAFGTFDTIGPIPGTDAVVTTPSKLSFVMNAQATQPFTQLYEINLNIRLAEAARAYEREQLRDARLALVANIRRAYYEIVKLRSALDAHERSIELLSELNRVVASRFVQKVALKSDALTAQSKLASAEVTRVELRQSLDSRKEQLNLIIGRDVRTAFDVVEMPEAIALTADLESSETRAIASRPDVKQARVRLEQAQLSRRLAKTDYLPDVALTVSYYAPLNISGAPRNITSGAIQMKWEPFDWGRKGRAMATKGLEVRQAENSVRDAEDNAVLEIRTRFRALETARVRLKAARANEDASRETARISLMQYGAQAALFMDVLQTQSAVADANRQYQEALAAFWSAHADFERSMAEDSNR